MKTKFQHDKSLVFYLVIYTIIQVVQGAPLTNGNVTKPGDLNGEKLIEFGIKLNLPKLQLIGKVIENIEQKIKNLCDLHPCLEWTEWNECNADRGHFGSKFRTRQCSVNMTACEIDATNSRTEKELGVCIGYCPKDYNMTKNRFCVKVYDDSVRTQDAAEHQCQKDGGHLINVDSEEKYQDVISVIQGLSKAVWIDGRRKDVGSPWEYKYGSQKGFFKWLSGQPGDGSTELCLKLYHPSTWLWGDNPCTSSYYSVCEITTIT
ncbi:type-2 ice-structuring protein-like [Mercenaria mercenaria]|uniref:type-2 ice-structuring protein-like n=1 Tax=Mercenaria mercenaria TaxID=6596 RepID=UPI00234EB3D7|nr:type-2 ice-structuring protein-like [Mercenaria mercenaria]